MEQREPTTRSEVTQQQENQHVDQSPELPREDIQSSPREETFARAGQDELPKRVKKLTGWRSKVLKHKDEEDIHKMRVASRRLRATMNAYEAICKPKPFKKAYTSVKNAADLLGKVRDADVMLEQIHDLEAQTPTQEQPGMRWLADRLQSYRQEQMDILDEFLHDFNEGSLKRQIETSNIKGASDHGKG